MEKVEGDTAHIVLKNLGMTKILQQEEVSVITEDSKMSVRLHSLGRVLAIEELVRAESGSHQGQMGQVAKIMRDAVYILQWGLDIIEVRQLYYSAWICTHTTLHSFLVPIN